MNIAAGNDSIHISAEKITCTYSLQSLKNGTLNELHVGSLEISLPKGPQQEAESGPRLSQTSFDRFFEQVLRAAVPVRQINIDRLHVNGLPPALSNQQPITFQLSNPEQQKNMELRTGLNSGALLKLNLLMAAEGKKEIEATASLTAPDITEQKAHLTLTPERLEATVNISLPRISNLLGPASQFKAQSRIDIQGTASWGDGLHFSMACSARDTAVGNNSLEAFTIQADGRLEQSGKLSLFPGSRLQAKHLQTGAASFDTLQMGLAGEYTWKQQHWSVTTAPGASLEIREIGTPGCSMETLIIQPHSVSADHNSLSQMEISATIAAVSGHRVDCKTLTIPEVTMVPDTPVQLTIAPGRTVLAPLRAHLAPLTVQAGDIRASVQATELDLNRFEYAAESVISQVKGHITGVKLQLPQYTIPLRTLDAEISSSGKTIAGTMQLIPEGSEGMVELQISRDIDTGKGSFNGKTLKPFAFQEDSPLHNFIQGKQLPFDLTGGQAACSFNGSWGGRVIPEASIEVHLENLAGSARGFLFTGLNTIQTLQFGEKIHTLKPGALTIDRLNTPVPLEHIQILAEVEEQKKTEAPAILFRNISADAVGGTVLVEPFLLSISEKNNKTGISLKNLDLAALIGYFKIPNLDVEGTLSGTLPVRQTEAGFIIDEGKVQGGDIGGVIRYQPPDTGERNQYTETALKALQEFYYSLLQAEVTYQQDGNLLVDIHLQGKSPHLSKTRPVHLNIHTEQNLLSLLQSVQYNSKITSGLNKKIQNSSRAGSHKQEGD